MKKLLLALLLATWIFLLGTIARYQNMKSGDQVPAFVKKPYADSISCRQCHAQIYDEWALSPHAKALSSTFPRMMDPGDKQSTCLPCHAPQPVLETGLDQPPLTRDDRRKEGVSCTTCHQTSKGMASAHSGLRGACHPVLDPRISQTELCQSCHNAHGTVDQWRESSYAQAGTDCLDCHMPASSGHRAHLMPGAHDHASLSEATDLGLSRNTDKLRVTVTNSGAGHNLPSGRRSRSMVLVVRFQAVDGQWVADHHYLFRNPFKGEPGKNSQLVAGETRGFDYPIPRDAVAARADLLYQFRPSQPDSRGVVLHTRVLDLKHPSTRNVSSRSNDNHHPR